MISFIISLSNFLDFYSFLNLSVCRWLGRVSFGRSLDVCVLAPAPKRMASKLPAPTNLGRSSRDRESGKRWRRSERAETQTTRKRREGSERAQFPVPLRRLNSKTRDGRAFCRPHRSAFIFIPSHAGAPHFHFPLIFAKIR